MDCIPIILITKRSEKIGVGMFVAPIRVVCLGAKNSHTMQMIGLFSLSTMFHSIDNFRLASVMLTWLWAHVT